MDNDSGDLTGFLAPQSLVTESFGPNAIGWTLQIYLTGAVTTLAFQYLSDVWRRANTRRDLWTTNNVLLMVASLADLAATVLNVNEIFYYLTTQKRSTATLVESYIPADVWVTIPQSVVGLCAQVFFALRCYKVIGKSRIFATLISLPILASFAAGIACALALYIPFAPENVLAVAELWLWATAGTDIIISAVLIICLAKAKREISVTEQTDYLLTRVIRLAIETAMLPAMLAIISAIIFICFNKSASLYNLFACFLDFLPTVYLFTFVKAISWRALPHSAQAQATEQTFKPSFARSFPITLPDVSVEREIHVSFADPEAFREDFK